MIALSEDPCLKSLKRGGVTTSCASFGGSVAAQVDRPNPVLESATSMATGPIWQPSDELIAGAEITRFQGWLRASKGLAFADYESLWKWSIRQPEEFWAAIWEYFKIPARRSYRAVMSGPAMPFVRWFEGSELNFVDQVFRDRALSGPAIIFES